MATLQRIAGCGYASLGVDDASARNTLTAGSFGIDEQGGTPGFLPARVPPTFVAAYDRISCGWFVLSVQDRSLNFRILASSLGIDDDAFVYTPPPHGKPPPKPPNPNKPPDKGGPKDKSAFEIAGGLSFAGGAVYPRAAVRPKFPIAAAVAATASSAAIRAHGGPFHGKGDFARERTYAPPHTVVKPKPEFVRQARQLYTEAKRVIPKNLQIGLVPIEMMLKGRTTLHLPRPSQIDFEKLALDLQTQRLLVSAIQTQMALAEETKRQKRRRDEEAIIRFLLEGED